MIDYHEFSTYLSKKGLPNSDSKTLHTVFREDYTHPSTQRCGTIPNFKIILDTSCLE